MHLNSSIISGKLDQIGGEVYVGVNSQYNRLKC
uniref:Uncharacterized protein n=1 Tax=Arundo donax TaxID=35708 RepID=A0A0A9H2S7_ARUDO